MSAAWAIHDLKKAYPTSLWHRHTHPALHGASLVVEAGERLGLIGPSGSGKTTLVRCGLGLVRADSGTVQLLGADTAGFSARDWRRARSQVQLLFQDARAMLHPDLPIGLLLEESAALHRPEQDPSRSATEALQAVGLDHRADALPRELSGGERRRAGIARVMLARPRLLVADEPTSGLDAVLKLRMIDLMTKGAGAGCAVVLVSHDLAAIAPFCDRIAVASGGRIVETFTTAALRAGHRATDPCTAELLQAAGFGVPVMS